MPIQKLPVQNLDDINHRRRAREVTNQILDHSFDDSRAQTPAEVASGVTPVNKAYPPGDIRRYGAVGDNSTDCYAAIQAAINVMEVNGGIVWIPEGIFRFSAKLLISAVPIVTIRGASWGSSILRKAFSGTGIEVDNAATPLFENFSLDRTGSDTGVGILLTETSNCAALRNLQVYSQGSHGIEHVHGNQVTYDTLLLLSNGGDGLKLNGAATPDVNACVLTNIDARGNTGWGVNLNNAWANFAMGITAQSNTAGGIRLNNARQNVIQVYSESNGGPQIEFVNTADCKSNMVTVVEGAVTFGGTTADRNVVLHAKRGAVFDPNFKKVTADRFILPSELQDGTAVQGSLEFKHTVDGVYEHAHSGYDATAESRFTHSNASFKHIVTTDALLLKKAATNSGASAIMAGSTTATTVGAAGGASALPATPVGYWIINVAGTEMKVPYYNT